MSYKSKCNDTNLNVKYKPLAIRFLAETDCCLFWESTCVVFNGATSLVPLGLGGWYTGIKYFCWRWAVSFIN